MCCRNACTLLRTSKLSVKQFTIYALNKPDVLVTGKLITRPLPTSLCQSLPEFGIPDCNIQQLGKTLDILTFEYKSGLAVLDDFG